MTRSNKTEKFDKILEPILAKVLDMGHYADHHTTRVATIDWAKDAIRKACKESGLQFFFRRRRTNQIGEDWMIEGIDV